MGFNLKKVLISLFLSTVLAGSLKAAEETTQLIDIPTASVVRKGNYQLVTRLYNDGGVLIQGNIGLHPRFNLGISYGGTKIISEQDPEWNPNVAMNFKYRLSDGDVNFPAIAIGYDAQGFGPYFKKDSIIIDNERYRNKSKGFYLVASQELKSLGGLALHGGANYSFEDKIDKSGNMFFGLNKLLGPEIMYIMDYDLGLNDDDKDTHGKGKGYLNAGFRWLVAPELSLEFDLLNLTENGDTGEDRISRIIKINYTNAF